MQNLDYKAKSINKLYWHRKHCTADRATQDSRAQAKTQPHQTPRQPAAPGLSPSPADVTLRSAADGGPAPCPERRCVRRLLRPCSVTAAPRWLGSSWLPRRQSQRAAVCTGEGARLNSGRARAGRVQGSNTNERQRSRYGGSQTAAICLWAPWERKIWRATRSFCGYLQGEPPTREELMGETRKVAVCKLTHGTWELAKLAKQSSELTLQKHIRDDR